MQNCTAKYHVLRLYLFVFQFILKNTKQKSIRKLRLNNELFNNKLIQLLAKMSVRKKTNSNSYLDLVTALSCCGALLVPGKA